MEVKKMNRSKIRDPRFWRKWYDAGAVKQKQYHPECLVFEGLAINFENNQPTTQVLSLGKNVKNGWELVVAIVVPYHPKYENWLHTTLKKIPNNGIPTGVFF
jgi:hypothetical protein